jgi:plastocyanin
VRRVHWLLVLVLGVAPLLGLVGAAGATAPRGKQPPVELEGEVNDEGTKTAKRKKITIEVDDFTFGPTFIKAKAGKTVKVKLEVGGSAPHTFTTEDGSVDESLASGDELTVKVKIPASGEPVPFFCSIHEQQGMKGSFFTKS